jgi:hypothetical protein
MFYFFYQKANLVQRLSLWIFLLPPFFLYAEGSKNLTPSQTGAANAANTFVGYLQHDDGANSEDFMKPGATDEQRLYVRINAGEQLFYGVRRIQTNAGANQNDLIITIRDNAGNIVAQNTLARDAGSPNQSTLLAQAGVIGSHAEAAAGPAAIVGAGGYNALSYLNTTGVDQDFYIEFTQVNEASLGAGAKSWYDLWDFSVYDGTTERPGRLYAKSWSITAAGGNNVLSTDFQMYGLVPSPSGIGFYVKEIDLQGIRPFGFFLVVNGMGTTTGTTVEERRQSQTSNTGYAEFPIFVSNPDSLIYPSAVAPNISISNFNTICNVTTGETNAFITFNSTQVGRTNVLIDLNGTVGYQPGTEDVIIEQEVTSPGLFTIVWDGLDGFGNRVTSGTAISYEFKFLTAPLHVPLWDVEGNAVGLSINDERPFLGSNLNYWDDSNLPAAAFDPQTMLGGTSTIVHDWGLSADDGNNVLVNTWSYGYSEVFGGVFSYVYNCDNDGDGINDYEDIDDDNDGIPDLLENATGLDYLGDADGDGVPNYLDIDDTVIPVPFVDVNGDGVHDYFDADLDGIPDALDLDSDNDGLPDLMEAGGVDTDGDGEIDSNIDTDGDGLLDIYDNDDTDGPFGSTPCSPQPTCVIATSTSLLFDTNGDGTNNRFPDTDNDGNPDYLDLDSDNDGIPDVVEAGGTDEDGDGYADNYVDADNDGFNDVLDGAQCTTSGESGTYLAGSSNGITDGNNATGLVDGAFAQVYDTGDRLVIDLGQLIPAGVAYALTWRRKSSYGDNAAADMVVEESSDNVTYSTHPVTPSTTSKTTFVTNLMIAQVATRYVRLRTLTGTGDDLDFDALEFSLRTCSTAGNPLIPTGPDNDADGLADSYTTGDFDGDGDLNHLDLDADNDGIQDILEAYGTDADGDGMVDAYTDTDNDGFHDPVDGDPGNDGVADNAANALVTTAADANNDGTPENYPNANADGRTLPNFLDLDSDNDGITDVVENASGTATGTATSDSPGSTVLDGMIEDGGITDGNTDGWSDTQAGNSSVVDTDGDGIPDPYDIDADNDGIPDYLEGTCSTCPSFTIPGGADINGNGVLDMYETLQFDNTAGGGNTGVVPNEDNNDGTAPADYLDLDSDNDTGMDWAEGFDNGFGGATAGDGNAAPEIINMALAYEAAGGSGTDYPNTDSDGDGLPDFLDNLVGFGYTNTSPPPFLDPLSPFWIDRDNDGLADLFDNEINGNAWGTTAPVPNNDALDDRDWRDINSYVDFPIELLSFEAERTANDEVLLDWKTASELNNQGFYIERMLENETEFTEVGWIDGFGTTSEITDYQFTDDNAFTGLSYYRLRQIDFDGTTSYTDVRVVSGSDFTIFSDVNLYPVPVNTELNIRLGKLPKGVESAQLRIVDVQGRILVNRTLAVNAHQVLTISDMKEWSAGTYILQIELDNGARILEQFIKQ